MGWTNCEKLVSGILGVETGAVRPRASHGPGLVTASPTDGARLDLAEL